MKNILRRKDYPLYDYKTGKYFQNRDEAIDNRIRYDYEISKIRKHLFDEFGGIMWCEKMRYGGLIWCPSLCPLPKKPFEVTEEMEVFTVHPTSAYTPEYLGEKVPDETFVLDRGIYQVVMPKDELLPNTKGIYAPGYYPVHWIYIEKEAEEYFIPVGISKGGCLGTHEPIDQVDWRAVRRIRRMELNLK